MRHSGEFHYPISTKKQKGGLAFRFPNRFLAHGLGAEGRTYYSSAPRLTKSFIAQVIRPRVFSICQQGRVKLKVKYSTRTRSGHRDS